MKNLTLIVILFLITIHPVSAGETCTLVISISGMTSDSGTIYIALAHDENSYASSRREAVRAVKVPVRSGQALARFTGLTPGYYAVKCFHDINDNGKLDKNLVGIPAEPFGFSNNYRVRFGPPSWDKSRFLLEKGEHTIHIKMRNL